MIEKMAWLQLLSISVKRLYNFQSNFAIYQVQHFMSAPRDQTLASYVSQTNLRSLWMKDTMYTKEAPRDVQLFPLFSIHFWKQRRSFHSIIVCHFEKSDCLGGRNSYSTIGSVTWCRCRTKTLPHILVTVIKITICEGYFLIMIPYRLSCKWHLYLT